jgi:hypothetical protein
MTAVLIALLVNNSLHNKLLKLRYRIMYIVYMKKSPMLEKRGFCF